MSRLRDEIYDYFAREESRTPTPAGLRSDVVIQARARAMERRAPQWVALVAAALAFAIIAGLLAAGSLRHLQPVPGGKLPPLPTPRAHAGVAYDDTSNQFVLFGGTIGNADAADTWTWDGKTWSLHHLATEPAARHYPALAYDASHREIVMFGGAAYDRTAASSTALSDTWTWNGKSWAERRPAHTPSLATNPDLIRAMSYDPISHRVLLYVERISGNETWSWNGTDWSQLHPTTDPKLTQAIMVSDGSQVLLIGIPPGLTAGHYIDQTWAWDGTTWTLRSARNNLPSNAYAAAFDAKRGEVVAINVGAGSSDTWIWDGTAWTRQHPTTGPSVMPYMAYVQSLHEIVAWADQFGGAATDLWAWDGSNWILLQRGSGAESTNNGGNGSLGPMSPSSAEALIRGTVQATSPVLLPSWLPTAMDAHVNATSDAFSVRYLSDQRDKTIDLGIVGANPPPGAASSSDTYVKFRNSVALKGHAGGYAEYFVYDPASPLSQRWLMWIEPGTMKNPMLKVSGVPYFLSTDGLTEQEFWQLANSLK